MDATSLPDLVHLLQNGSNVGIIVIVYVAFQLKAAVANYLTGVNATLEELKNAVLELRNEQTKIQAEVEELKRITLPLVTQPLRIGNG